MFREALTYPVRGETAEESLLVGVGLAVATGLLARLGVLAVLAVVPLVLLAGYALAVVRQSAATDRASLSERTEAPPRFTNFRKRTGEGLRTLAVAVGYLFVPVVALVVTVGGALGGATPTQRSATLETSAVVLGAGTVVLVASLAFAYLLPAALVSVARTGRIRSAVATERLRRTVTSARYFVGWVAALVVGSSAGLLCGALASLGRPGEVVALAVGFYAVVVVARLVGRGAGSAG